MHRIKVVNDVGDLVSIFHVADSDVKRKVFQEVTLKWCTMEEIKEKYAEEGKEALTYLEKIKLVETQWKTTPEGPKKIYHTYYSIIQINISCSIMEISDIIYAATMTKKDIENYENKIRNVIKGDEGVFFGDAVENLKVSEILLRGVIKRSTNFEIKGHRIMDVS